MESDYQRRYYAANRERRIAQSVAYQREHADERREYMREWNERNRDRVKEYRQATAERRNARRRERYATDTDYRERTKLSARSRDPRARKDSRLRASFGIGVDEFDAILAAQGGGCAICGGKQRLHVDHCHDAGHIRGILCSECNLGLGKFHDDADRIERAALYLRARERGAPDGQ